MANPLVRGSCSSYWIALLVVIATGTLAAPQQDRRIIKVSASFGGQPDSIPVGSGRALSLSEEPIIITEPLPGQEFVFISAQPSSSGSRTARVQSEIASLPFITIEDGVPAAVLNEDGILVAEHVAEHDRTDRQLDHQQDAPNWSPLSLPELLTGPALVRPQNEFQPDVKSQSNTEVETIAESFSSKGGADEFVQHPSSIQKDSEQTVVQTEDDLSQRQSESIDNESQADESNLIPAESVSRRTVIKTAPNGQDYEYEYLYYDGSDVDESANNDTGLVKSQEPTLFSNDQEAANLPTASTTEAVAVVEEVTTETAQDELVEVNEAPQVSKIAFTVGDEIENVNVTSDQADQVPVVEEDATMSTIEEEETTTATTTSTSTTTTTTTTTAAPTTTSSASRRRRPTTVSTTTAPVRVRGNSSNRLTIPRRGSSTESTTESSVTSVRPSISSSRVRGRNRFSAPVASLDAISDQPKTDVSSPRRRLTNPTRTRGTSTLESRTGLAEDRSRFTEFDGEDFATGEEDVNGDNGAVSSLNNNENGFSRQSQTIERFPVNSRFPPRFQDDEFEEGSNDFSSVQGRAPLRVVESSSFRNTGNNQLSNPVNEQVSVGRLTVISGPARLPTPLSPVSENIDADLETEIFEVRPTFTLLGPVEEITEESVQQVPVEPEILDVETNVHEEAKQTEEHNSAVVGLPVGRPDLIDLLAFSRAAEQQQQDDSSQVAGVEEVLIEEVTTTSVPTAETGIVIPDDWQFVGKVSVEAGQVPTVDSAPKDAEIGELSDEMVTTVEPEEVKSIDEIQQIQANVDTPLSVVLEGLSITESSLEDVIGEVVDTQDVTVSEELTTSTTTSTTTTEATTTVETTTPAPTTTTATSSGSRIRGPSRFTGGISSTNRFNSRIRNRVRGGSSDASTSESDVTATTTTASSSPITAAPTRRNNFRPAGGSFGRLRRPSSTETPKTTSDENSDRLDANDTDSSTTTTTSTTRRTVANIRNRFSPRRNQTKVEPAADSEEVRNAVPVTRPRPSAPLQNNRIASPRPMSSILKRGRFSTTSTTTTSTESAVSSEDINMNATSTETIPLKGSDSVEQDVIAAVTESTTTTTTTARSVGLNRLRTRLPLAVSERPKVVRNQVSLSDRRNRFSVLANSRKTNAETAETAVVDNKEVTEKLASAAAVDGQVQPTDEAVADKPTNAAEVLVDNEPSESSESAVRVAPTSLLRSRRPSRIPGQLVARRTSSN